MLVTIDPNAQDLPPEVSISSPANNVKVWADRFDAIKQQWYAVVVVDGSAIDPEDGRLVGDRLVWTEVTLVDGSETRKRKTRLGAGERIAVRLHTPGCGGKVYQVTLTTTDSCGNTSTFTVNIAVDLVC